MATRNSSERRAHSLTDFYRQRIAEYDRDLAAFDRRSITISRLRGVTFFTALVVLGWAWLGEVDQRWLAVGVAVALTGFIGLVAYHEKVIERANILSVRRRFNLRQLRRIERDWRRVPVPSVSTPERDEAVVRDLDLLGDASLFQLMCCAHTPLGIIELRDWLLHPASVDEIRLRQQAAQQLAGMRDFREELDLCGNLVAASSSGPASFLEWAESTPWLSARPWLKWTTRILLLVIVSNLVLGLTGVVSLASSYVVLVGLVLVSMLINVLFTGQVHEIFDLVDSKHNEVVHYHRLFELVDALPDDSTWCARLKREMGSVPGESLRHMKALGRIMKLAMLRRSGLFGVLHLGFQIVFLLDFHVLSLLEFWQRRNGHHVRQWFRAVGQLECMASLAALAHDHPDWAWPVSSGDDEVILEARQLGHPLLPDEACVRNDVWIGPPGTFLLVTGSNMSGKSTLLRAIGVNVMLAQAGGPVCARQLSLPPLVVASSMRIQDSLEQGVSFFMAELKRLKEIVDQSLRYRPASQTKLLFLLDEILQGTNSAERHIAVSRVIGRLLNNGAMGAVSTHDLALASSPELSPLCQTAHFRETIHGQGTERRMTFDYRMRSGLATTTNALKLLQLVGLVDEAR